MKKTIFIVLVALLAIVIVLVINADSFWNFFMSRNPAEDLYMKRALVIGLIAFSPMIAGLLFRWLFKSLDRKHRNKQRR